MIIKVMPEDTDDVAIKKSEGLVGQLIYVNWPYPRLAKITGFMTRQIAADPNAFDREIRVIKEKMLTTRGIDVGIVSSVCLIYFTFYLFIYVFILIYYLFLFLFL